MLAVYVICFHRTYLLSDTEENRRILEAAVKEIGQDLPAFPATDELEELLDAYEPLDAYAGYNCTKMYVVNLEW